MSNFPSEKYTGKFEIGEYAGDLSLLKAIVVIMEGAKEIDDNLKKVLHDTHAVEMWVGPIPILYDTEVMGYVVFEEFGPTYYKSKEKDD